MDDVEEDEFVPADEPVEPDEPDSDFSPIRSDPKFLELLDDSVQAFLRLLDLGLLLLSLSRTLSLSSLSRLEDEFLSRYDDVLSLSLSPLEFEYFEFE